MKSVPSLKFVNKWSCFHLTKELDSNANVSLLDTSNMIATSFKNNFDLPGKSTLPQYLGGHWLTHGGKCQIFKNFPKWHPGAGFSPQRQRNKLGWLENLASKLTNILHWIKSIYTKMSKRHWIGWETFKCQKLLLNISLAIKESLRIENGTQYTNHQMNSAIKNQIYPEKSQQIYLYWLYNTTVSLSTRLILPIRRILEVHWCKFETFRICSCSCKNNTLKVSLF